MDKTKKVLIEMFTEFTGVSILDSGDAYGRNFERNRKIKDWDSIPEVEPWFCCKELGPIIHLFPFLNNRLEFEEELTKDFYKWLDEHPDEYSNDVESVKKWVESHDNWIHKDYGLTYNFDTFLDQGFQYNWFIDDKLNEHIAIMIHGGADIRGGYTDAKIFLFPGTNGFQDMIYDMQNQSLFLKTTKGEFGLDFMSYYENYEIYFNKTGTCKYAYDTPASEIFETDDKSNFVEYLQNFKKLEDIPGFISCKD